MGVGGRGFKAQWPKIVWTFLFYGFIRENSTHPMFKRGSNILQGGPTFSRGGGGGGGGGVQMLISIETHITCNFPGGLRTPNPPL